MRGVVIKKVMRPSPMGPDEPWLDVTNDGKHIGWLPVGTSKRKAQSIARRWVGEHAAIELAAADTDWLLGKGSLIRNARSSGMS